MAQMQMNAFREFLQRQMNERGMSINQFAEFIGVANSTVSRAVSYKKDSEPSLDFLSKLAEATNTDIAVIAALLYPDLTMRDAEAWLMVEQIRRLSEDDRRLIDTYLAGVAAKKKASQPG